MKSKLLLSVDGSKCSGRAAQFVADLGQRVQDLEVHLVNVQPRGDDWMVRRLLKPEELARMERDWAESSLGPARATLEAAGVACVEHFEQGDVAKTITHLAEQLECDQIVMGTRGMSALGELILGSTANKVLALTKVPVTFVK
ncbi:MAG: universal stress protein [Planctomycetota bacterium]